MIKNWWRFFAAIAITAVTVSWGAMTLQFAVTVGAAGPEPFVSPYLNEVWADGYQPTLICAQGIALVAAGWAGALWSRTFRG